MDRNELIEEHYRLNYTRLVKTVTRRVPNKSVALAEEVVQEAYTRALKYYATYEPEINTFDKWFGGILRNATNDCRTTEGSRGTIKEYDENTEDIRVSRDEYKHLHHIMMEIHAIQKYSNRDYTILMMFYVHGFTSRDISIYLNVTHSNVRQIIYKFKNKVNEISNGDV
jgi:RNA polymerase sigma factor (sigma-70 family)